MDRIQSYNLFGEIGDLPDVVHCETIETRSLIHDWVFPPHRHSRLHQFLLIEAGGGRGSFDERNFEMAPAQVLNVPIGCVHSYSFRPGTQGWVVTLASEVLDEALAEAEGLRPLLSRPAILGSTPEIRRLVKAIFQEYDARRFARAHMLRSQSALLAGLVARRLAEAGAATEQPEQPLQRRLEALIEQHFRDHWGVGDYANALAVSPTHLSRVLRQATGQPASAMIEERLVREARRNLAYSNLSVSEIAYQLGFSDPAYFSRVFSRATGLSPRAFRARVENPARP